MNTIKVRATITIEFDLFNSALTDNITPCEIGDAIASRYDDARIVHAAWGKKGEPWLREWVNE